MIAMETRDFSQEEWHNVLGLFSDTSLIQLWEYGKAKQELQGWEVVHHIFRNGQTIVGVAQAMVKRIPVLRKGVVWLNRGPLWQQRDQIPQPEAVADMLRALKQYWVAERGMYLRVAPTLYEAEDALAILSRAGFRLIKDAAWVSARLDLCQSVEALRANLEKKWRNGLKKAETFGLEHTIGNGPENTQHLLEDYEEFLRKKNFSTPVTAQFVGSLQRMLPDPQKMWVLSAFDRGRRLGSILLAPYNTTVEYLVGALGEDGKRLNAGQYLLWNGILEMKQRGYERFDLGGMHPQKTPVGILRFKQGLGATSYALMGSGEAYQGVIARGIRLLVESRL